MRHLLRPKQRLSAESTDAPVGVEEFVAEGGQGEVHACTFGGVRMAVKWYPSEYCEFCPRLRARLMTSINRGAPNASFAWPIDIVTSRDQPGFGYVMPWIESRFRSWFAAMGDNEFVSSFKRLSLVCREVETGYQALHAKGLCYHDIKDRMSVG